MESRTSQTRNVISQKHHFLGGCRCGGKKSPRKTKCNNITTDNPVKKPDLAIYSQQEELNGGNVPNWDSPDITTNYWRPFRLLEEAKVKIRNLSPTVPAINALVHYSISPFGIGTRKELKLTQLVNVAPSSEFELRFPLHQDTLEGDPRVGVHIQIEHPHDTNPVNNSGSQVIDTGYTSESGRIFTVSVPVYNDANFSREIRLSLMPTDVVASVNIQERVFAAHEQIVVELNIQIPDFLHGTPSDYLSRAVTLVGRLSTGELIGGVTRLIRIDD